MSDLHLVTGQLADAAACLQQIEPLTPPPTPKGRYVLAKASEKIAAEAASFGKRFKAFLDGAVTKDDEGKPIYATGAAPGQMTFTVLAEHTDAYTEINAEPVVISGLRQITRAELGACPITIQQERVLVAIGLLEDAEPA